jgi:rod shape-determining protein MreC
LRAENERLITENERLRQYQTAVMRLEAENKGLRDLLKMQADPAQSRITARVIADVGGPFLRNVVILAGRRTGVRDGLVALAGGGLAGRVVSAGNSSSRVLLINDINARVPVLLEGSRQRGLVEGDNTPELRLTSLPPDVVPTLGERLVTSGVGGIFPAGIPVGIVSRVEGGLVRVEPLADLGRLELVQILDPGTPPDLLSPESARPLRGAAGN